MIRAKVNRKLANSISGYKTDSVFDRYNITRTDDVKDAVSKVVEYRRRRFSDQ
jgi:hypothetical protein